MGRIPEIITHNYHPDRGAFRNICSLPEADAEQALDDIRASVNPGLKRNYLAKRRRTERWLLSERERKLGTPYLAHPVYFFLGDFADEKDPVRPRSIRLPLAIFAPETITFTFPDSMASLPIATHEAHTADRKFYHGQVFTLDEIERVVAAVGLPGGHRQPDPSAKYDRFIEVQVWDDRPINRFIGRAATSYNR